MFSYPGESQAQYSRRLREHLNNSAQPRISTASDLAYADRMAEQQRGFDESLNAQFRRVPLPELLPPVHPSSFAQAPAVNPAVREAQVKEVKEKKEASEASGRHKWHGSRKSYIPTIGEWLNKKDLLDNVRAWEQDLRRYNATSDRKESPEELEKQINRHRFSLMKQYKLSKHEPDTNTPGNFGKMRGGASSFLDGSYSDKIQGWRWMKPEEQDAMIAAESDAVNMPKIAAQQAERRQAADNHRYEQQAKQFSEDWENLTPAEKEMVTYNRQLAEYNEAVQRNQNLEMVHQQQANQQPNFGPQMGEPMMSPVMLDNLAIMTQGNNTQYVPVRPKRSINQRIMQSFDPNMFSPEFIPEEENGY